jgi:serine/threonine protein kinase
MILPKEKMDNACGTLSYVAPEVLTMQGYGKEADLWSVGVIMFLLMCGKLPFDGDDHNEIIRNTIQAELKPNLTIWNKLSEEARSLMNGLLNKVPKDRITAREALKHPFISKYAPKKDRHASMSRDSILLPPTPAIAPAAVTAAHPSGGAIAVGGIAGDASPMRAGSYAGSESESDTDLPALA